jgi:hypothetical protein
MRDTFMGRYEVVYRTSKHHDMENIRSIIWDLCDPIILMKSLDELPISDLENCAKLIRLSWFALENQDFGLDREWRRRYPKVKRNLRDWVNLFSTAIQNRVKNEPEFKQAVAEIRNKYPWMRQSEG